MLFLIVFLATLLLSVTYLFFNYCAVSPSIPGPFLARFTDFWRAYYQYNGLLRSKLVALHVRHGPVVRYGIRSISLTDPAAIEVIYGSRAGFVTADSYKVLAGISNGKEVPSLVSTRDEVRHAQLRRSVASAFTVKGASEYEGFVDTTIPELMDAMRRPSNGRVDLSRTTLLYSMDSAAAMAFNESLGCLRTGEDVGGSLALISNRLKHWGHWSSVPWLERLVFRNPWAMRQSRGQSPSAIVSTAVQKVRARMATEKEERAGDILAKFTQAQIDHPHLIDAQGVVSLLMSTISGAGDTTALTMSVTLFYLCRKPETMEKLRDELAQAGLTKGEVPPYATTSKLPYLAAVIKEAMRLFPVQTWPVERLVPSGGITVSGQFLPQGTSVGIFIPSLHLNTDVFGADVEVFRPERWLDPDTEKLKRMEQVFMGFSRGPRGCLGQHVAVLQMKKVIPSLVLGFEMGLVREGGIEADMSPAVAILRPLWVDLKER